MVQLMSRNSFQDRVPSRFFRDINSHNMSAGFMSAILGITGPTILILSAAHVNHLANAQVLAWIAAVNVVGGLFSIILPVLLHKPVTVAHSLMGVAFLVTQVGHYSFSDLVGAYLVSALLIFVVGFSGLYGKLMSLMPIEVISAMLAGVITTYVVHLVSAVVGLPTAGLAAVAGYVLCGGFIKRIPPILGGIFTGSIALVLTGGIAPITMGQFYLPAPMTPSWSFQSVISVAIPLSILVISNDITPGIGALKSFGFDPPIRMLVSWSGIASAVAALFGGQSANVAGMMSAICAGEDAGVFHKRYVASIVSGFLLILFGLGGWFIVPVVRALPMQFVAVLAGLSLLTALRSSLQTAFVSSRHWLSPIAAFAVALSGISYFHVTSTVWALIIGLVLALGIEHRVNGHHSSHRHEETKTT